MSSSVGSKESHRCLNVQLEILAVTLNTKQKSHHDSIPSPKRLLVFGTGFQGHRFYEDMGSSDLRNTRMRCYAHHSFPSVSNTSYTIIILSIRSYSGRTGSLQRHMKLQRLSRWIDYIIFWVVWDHDPTSTSFEHFIISIYFVIFFWRRVTVGEKNHCNFL